MAADRYLHRSLEGPILDASRQFPVVLVTGPRQAGKTTLLRHLAGDDRRYVTLDDLALRELAQEDPALFLQRFPAPVLIDEVQYAPRLLPYVKLAVDDDAARGAPAMGAFWLTGSQQFRLMAGVTESLAGRVAVVQLLGLSARERDGREPDLPPFLPTPEGLAERGRSAAATSLGEVFAAIFRGTLPALASGAVADRDLFYSSYLQTYLERDVRDLARVGDQAAFHRFLRVAAARTAQLLNLSDLARDVDVSVATAKSWLSILEASFQVHLLRPYHSNVTSRLVKAPKLYFLDPGLAAYLTGWSSPETLAAGAMAGAIFETHVVVEVLKSWWHRLKTPPLHFYRDKDGNEVDLVVERDGVLHPLEVKLAATPRRDWARPLTPLRRLGLPIGPGAVVCLAPDLVPLTEDVAAVPVGWI